MDGRLDPSQAHRLSEVTAFFGGEDGAMGTEGGFGVGVKVSGIAGKEGLGPCLHEVEIPESVAVEGGVGGLRMDIDKGESSGGKIEMTKRGGFPLGADIGADRFDAVIFEQALVAEDAGFAAAIGGEGGHRKGEAAAVVVKSEDMLRIDDIIITCVDATPVGSCAEGLENILRGGVGGDDIDRPAGFTPLEGIEVPCGGRIRAGVGERALGAAVSGFGRTVGRGEVIE